MVTGAARLLAIGVLLGACRTDPPRPTVAYAWPVMDLTLSLAAWGPDSAALTAAAERVIDTARAIDSVPRRELVRTLRAWWNEARSGMNHAPDWEEVAGGYLLDRASRNLEGVADSALLDLSGQYLWVGPPTHRAVGIADPKSSLRTVAVVELSTGSLRTKAERHRSVTVLAPSGAAAAAWASVLFPLECDRALAVPAVSVICADSSGVRWTADLNDRVGVPMTLAERAAAESARGAGAGAGAGTRPRATERAP